MRAIVMTACGSPDVLEWRELPEPEIQSDTQVKLRIRAAGVNPIDTKIRRNGLFYGAQAPAILGLDGAAEIIERGAKARRFEIGDQVWYCHGGLGREPGNYAEFNVIEQDLLAPMPSELSFEQAAAGPLVLITAWGALFDRGNLQAEQTVLIHAGAGGVGHVALQLAKSRGAKVIATAGDSDKVAWLKQQNIDLVVNYHDAHVNEQILDFTQGQGADLVLDTVGPEVFKQSIALTKHFGRLITLLDPGASDLKEARLRNLLIGFELMLTPMLRDLNEARQHQLGILKACAELISSNQLSLHVSQGFELANAAQAHKLIEEGHVWGKLVLRVSP